MVATPPHGSTLAVCIVQPAREGVSETFLKGQSERLPGRITVLHGFPPQVDGRPFWSASAPARALRKCRRILTCQSHEDEVTAAFVDALEAVRPDVVLAQYGPTGTAVDEACGLLDIPLVVHFHGYDASQLDVLQEHRFSYPRMFRRAAAIIAVSQPMVSKLVSLGADPGKVHWNPCGVDGRSFGGAAPAASGPRLLAAGRFVEKKAPLLTIRAFAAASERVPEARLLMIGDGPLMPSCRALLQQLGLQHKVTLLGAQPPTAVRREMAQARAFVQHSVEAPSGDSEGMPVSILEAGASGLPVISTRHAGIPEAVLEQVTGILVDEHDVAGMANAMIRLLKDPALAGRMGERAREHVLRHFAIDDRIERLAGILRAAADPGRSIASPVKPANAVLR